MTLEMNSITFYNVNILIILRNVHVVKKNFFYYCENLNVLIFRNLLT